MLPTTFPIQRSARSDNFVENFQLVQRPPEAFVRRLQSSTHTRPGAPFGVPARIEPQPATLYSKALNVVLQTSDADDIRDAITYARPAGDVLESAYRNHVLRTIASRTDAAMHDCLFAAYRAFQEADSGISVMPMNEAFATGDRALAKAAILLDPQAMTQEQFDVLGRHAPELAVLAGQGNPELVSKTSWLNFQRIFVDPLTRHALQSPEAAAEAVEMCAALARQYPTRAVRIAGQSNSDAVWRVALEVGKPLAYESWWSVLWKRPHLVLAAFEKDPSLIDVRLLQAIVVNRNHVLLARACTLNPGALTQVDQYGETAAHRAGAVGDAESLRIMRHCGADLNIRDPRGHTAQQLADLSDSDSFTTEWRSGLRTEPPSEPRREAEPASTSIRRSIDTQVRQELTCSIRRIRRSD